MKRIIALINAEIKWCRSNPDARLSKDYQLGFIKGLEQAKYLIRQAEKAT